MKIYADYQLSDGRFVSVRIKSGPVGLRVNPHGVEVSRGLRGRGGIVIHDKDGQIIFEGHPRKSNSVLGNATPCNANNVIWTDEV